MNKLIKLLPFILSIHLSYGQNTTYSDTSTDGQNTDDTNSILQNIETYLENLGSYLGYDVTTKPTTTTTDTLLNDGSTQKKLENYTVQMFFGFINYNWSYPYFLPANSNTYATAFNKLCGTVFSSSSFSPSSTSAAIDLQYNNSNSSSASNSFSKNPVTQYLFNMLYITPNDICIDNTTLNWTSNYGYCEGLVLANALGLGLTNDGIIQNTSSSTTPPINQLGSKIAGFAFNSYYPSSNPSSNSNTYLLQQLDSTSFMGPLMYDSSSTATSSNSSSTTGLATANQLEAAQNYVRYITGGVMPKAYSSYQDLTNAIKGINGATNVSTQMNYFKPFARYMLDFRIYAARMSLAVQNIYDSLAYRMNLNSSSSSSDSSNANSQQSSQALNEYIMASYRLYNPNAQSSSTSSDGTLQTTPWQDMINTASPATVQKEMALLLAEINYQLYQMRQQQEKLILTNSVFLLNNLTEPSLAVPSTADASSGQTDNN